MIWVAAVFIFMLVLGTPIVFAFAFSSFVYILTSPSLDGESISAVFYSSLDSFPLMAIPFFIFAGDLMVQGGISKRIVEFIRSFMGRIKGFLGSITVTASIFFSAVSGSAVATVAAVGSMMLPEMNRANYPKGYSAALTAAASFLGFIIPPSIPMIMFGFLTNTSIAELFIGGVTPGILLGATFLILHFIMVRKMDVERDSLVEADGEIKESQIKLENIIKTGRRAILALLMPVIIIGGIYSGIFTPTESAVVAVFYAIIVGVFFHREIKVKSFFSAARKSALNTAMILITLVFATIFSRILTLERVPERLADAILNLTEQEWMIILILILFLLLVGMVMDAITGVILVTPILFPIAVTQIGMDPVHFGVIVIVALSIGMITPPMAMNIFLAAKIAGASVKETFKYNIPFLTAAIAILIALAFFPILVTGLSGLFG